MLHYLEDHPYREIAETVPLFLCNWAQLLIEKISNHLYQLRTTGLDIPTSQSMGTVLDDNEFGGAPNGRQFFVQDLSLFDGDERVVLTVDN